MVKNMSYEVWTVDGYGICTSGIKTTKKKVEKLLKLAPEFNKYLQDRFKELEIKKPKLEDYLSCDDDDNSGIAYLLQQVVREVENIRLDIAQGFDGDSYLLITPAYLWSDLTEEEKNLNTQEKASNLFKKYVGILTDDEFTVEYQSVENGG